MFGLYDNKSGGLYAKECNQGDIIEMKLDFERLELSFKMILHYCVCVSHLQ